MANQLNARIRGPEAYEFARQAILAMESSRVTPTPLNYELWLFMMSDPQGALASEIEKLLTGGEFLSDEMAERLASEHLPRLKLTDEIRDTGDALNRQLDTISRAIDTARQSSEAFGRTLEGAGRELAAETRPPNLQELVAHLADATRRAQRENGLLELRLTHSTGEVRRLREHLEQVRRDSMTDALTALANRKAFDEALEQLCPEEGEEAPLCLAMIDIDHFKRFNDTWGHQTGDQVLRYVANVIGRTGAAPRFAARYGGEEFAILFPSETAATARKALELVRVEIASRALKRRSTNEDLGAVTISCGLAQRRAGEPSGSLMERADAALYASKHAGRNRVTDAETLDVAA